MFRFKRVILPSKGNNVSFRIGEISLAIMTSVSSFSSLNKKRNL